MKKPFVLIPLFSLLVMVGCNSNTTSNPSGDVIPTPGDPGDNDPPTPIDDTPVKVTVDAHTISDDDEAPITVGGDGEAVSKETWESFRSASTSFFNSHYNYTYTSYSGGVYMEEYFTQNGYCVESAGTTMIYERKSGNTFYTYFSTNNYQRGETTLDLQSKYTYRIQHEIYVHMFDYENYEFDSSNGTYNYIASNFNTTVKFQNGYLTYLYYLLHSPIARFEIKEAFNTTIAVPKSFYYK